MKNLFKIIENLLKKLLEKDQVLSEAIQIMDKQNTQITNQEKRILELEKLLEEKTDKVIRKDSSNSDLPPSKDIVKPKRGSKNKDKKRKKPGRKKGHKGDYLKLSANPDKIEEFYPKLCINCHSKLDKSTAVLYQRKQEIDLPEIQPIVTEYQSYQIACNCGCTNKGLLPTKLKARVQYGPRVRSFVNYSQVYQYLPCERLKNLLKEFFNLKISEGTFCNILKSSSKKAAPLYENIRVCVENSKVVGADETPIRVNNENWYFWVWQNKQASYITAADSRKKENIYQHFPNGFADGILVSDRYKSHLNTPAKGHQLCWAHLIRKLNYLDKVECSDWLIKLRGIYSKAKKLKKDFEKGKDIQKARSRLEARLTRLLADKQDEKQQKETETLRKSLIEHKDKILAFLHYKQVPSHNNASELAIRNAKIKMKISGCFRNAQQPYAIIRSVVDTCIKQGISVFQALLNIENGQPMSWNFS